MMRIVNRGEWSTSATRVRVGLWRVNPLNTPRFPLARVLLSTFDMYLQTGKSHKQREESSPSALSNVDLWTRTWLSILLRDYWIRNTWGELRTNFHLQEDIYADSCGLAISLMPLTLFSSILFKPPMIPRKPSGSTSTRFGYSRAHLSTLCENVQYLLLWTNLQSPVPKPFGELRIQLHTFLSILWNMNGAKYTKDVFVFVLLPVDLLRKHQVKLSAWCKDVPCRGLCRSFRYGIINNLRRGCAGFAKYICYSCPYIC